jgi:hypothetical protein
MPKIKYDRSGKSPIFGFQPEKSSKSAETVLGGGYFRFYRYWKEPHMFSIFLAVLVHLLGYQGAGPADSAGGPIAHPVMQPADSLGPAG